MKRRMDLLTDESLPGIEVFQLTSGQEQPYCHLYSEAQIFTPDSKRFLLHSSAHPHGFEQHDSNHHYLLCDLENDGELTPLLTEMSVAAPSISPDGRYVYYFIDETTVGGGKLTVKRVGIDGSDRRTLIVVDKPFAGTTFRPSRLYPLSTISSDGKRLAISAFLGDGKTEQAPWGLMVFDLEKCTSELIFQGTDWCNMHAQYCRSADPQHSHDIMIQHNHGAELDVWGNRISLLDRNDVGADIHLIWDDGTNFRDFPWGRDDVEFCQGHQCWQGTSNIAITSTYTDCQRDGLTWKGDYNEARLIQGLAVAHQGHYGIHTQNAWRNDLTKNTRHPDFIHFATDRAGTTLVTDSGTKDHGGGIYIGTIPAPATSLESSASQSGDFSFMLRPRSSEHMHPFLSPDGKKVFFNSNESGTLHAYMITLP